MKDVKFSVVIPAYNSEDTIDRALDSVFNQKYKPYEVIVVNDGSKDNTLNVLNKYNSKILIVDKGNGGVSSARNEGIAVVTGTHVAFLDADDQWNLNHLQYAYDFFCGHETIPWYGGVIKKTGSREVSKINQSMKSALDLDDEALRNFFIDAYVGDGFLITTSTIVIETSILKDLHGFKEYLKTGEDRELWFRIALRHPFLGYNKDDINNYFLLENSLSSNKQDRFLRRLIALSEIRKENKGFEVEGVNGYVDNEYSRSFRIGLRDGCFNEIIELKDVWGGWPFSMKKFILNCIQYIPSSFSQNDLLCIVLAKLYGY